MVAKSLLARLLGEIWNLVRRLIILGVFLALGLVGLCGLIIIQGRRDDLIYNVRFVDALLVMGAPQWNGQPSPVLGARLDHALELYRRGVAARIILTGGVGEGDALSEAAVAKVYLLDQGVPENALLLEETSRSSLQNLRNAAEIARNNGIASVLIVSDDFHMLRSLKMARDLGLKAYGSPTPSSPIRADSWLELQYVLREAGAYLLYIFFRR